MRTFFLALLICAAGPAQAVADFANSLPAGPHRVGFRVLRQVDNTRVFKTAIDGVSGKPVEGLRTRPMRTLVWYPAQAGGTSVVYRDYMATAVGPDQLNQPPAEARHELDALVNALSGSASMKREIARTMLAMADAPARDGKFPVVIYAPSFSAAAAENVDLCEYLASQGYIVLSSASMGARTRFMTEDLEGLEAQVADIAFLVGYAHRLPQADTEHIGVAGFSWGGLANVMAAAKDDRIKALVSLDGSLRGYSHYVDGGKRSAHYVKPTSLTAPLMFIGRRMSTIEEMNREHFDTTFRLHRQMRYADTYVLTMAPMRHADFSSWHQRFAPDRDFEDYSREEVAHAYRWTVRYAHRFFDAYLKGDRQARDFINSSPRANQAPAHMMTADNHAGDPNPPTTDAFVRLLNARGFQHAVAIHNEMKAKDDSFSPGGPNAINSWAYQLLRGGREKEGLELFKFGVHLYPTNANLYDSLGEACEKTGAREEAIHNYRRSLELDPKNANAVERLRVLQQQS